MQHVRNIHTQKGYFLICLCLRNLMHTFVSNADLWLCLGSSFFFLVPIGFHCPACHLLTLARLLHASSPRSCASSGPTRRPPPTAEEHGRCSPTGRPTPTWPPTWRRTGMEAQCRYSSTSSIPLNFPVPFSLCNHFVPNQHNISTWTSWSQFSPVLHQDSPAGKKGQRLPALLCLCFGKAEQWESSVVRSWAGL